MNFDLEDTRRKLIAKRGEVSAKTAAGYACSNLIEGLENAAAPQCEFQKWQLETNLIPHMMKRLAARLDGRKKAQGE